MLFFLFSYLTSSNADIPNAFIGTWDVTSFRLTSNGIEIPNSNNYSLNLSFDEEERYINGHLDIYPNLKNEHKPIFIQMEQIYKSFPKFSVKISNSSNEQLSTSIKIDLGVDNMASSTGKFMNLTYSFDLISPNSAELTTFNDNSKEVTIYKFFKKSSKKFSYYHLFPFLTAFISTAFNFLFN